MLQRLYVLRQKTGDVDELGHDVGTMDTAAAGQPSPKRRSDCETLLMSAGMAR
jgi:hypothetical protein